MSGYLRTNSQSEQGLYDKGGEGKGVRTFSFFSFTTLVFLAFFSLGASDTSLPESETSGSASDPDSSAFRLAIASDRYVRDVWCGVLGLS